MNSLALPPIAAVQPRPLIRWGWLAGLIFALAALAPRVGFMARPFESDAGLYIYMGKTVAEGRIIYRDFYETKPPGVPLLTAGLYKVFGGEWAGYVLFQTVLAIAAGLVLARVASAASRSSFSVASGASRCVFAPPSVRDHLLAEEKADQARLCAFAFALVFLNLSPLAYRGFQLETITTAIACFSAYFAWRTLVPETDPATRCFNALLGGLFAGAAAMLKPTAAAVFGAMALVLILRRRDDSTHRPSAALSSLAAGILGLLIIPAITLAWTARHGAWSYLPQLFREIALYGSQTPLVWTDLFKPAMALVFAGFPFAIARFVFPRESQQRPGSSHALFRFASAWLILECLGIYLQKRMYMYHFLPIAAPLALLFGLLCSTRGPAGIGRLWAALGPILVLSLVHSAHDFQSIYRGDTVLPESRFLQANARPGDTVVGDPIERLLMETGLRCGSRYAHLFYFANHDNAPREYGRQFLYDLDRNRPTWAVFDSRRAQHRQWQIDDLAMFNQRPARAQALNEIWQQIDSYLASHYRLVATVNNKCIYKRLADSDSDASPEIPGGQRSPGAPFLAEFD